MDGVGGFRRDVHECGAQAECRVDVAPTAGGQSEDDPAQVVRLAPVRRFGRAQGNEGGQVRCVGRKFAQALGDRAEESAGGGCLCLDLEG
ncbi:hypothetical protein [Streptomyces katrae]|uniref:hypothetical protein n=1 Tax=Streptomyces katrae TaxID=68223 RepID=UPI00131B4AFE|nr:hypothetical protein [Streptomyces katrae]